jgi:hypothetical protein
MKRFLSIFLSTVLLLSLNAPAYADNLTTSTEEEISTVYGIPKSIFETLPTDIQSSLTNDIENIIDYSTQTTYIKVSHTDSGERISSQSTYQDYLKASTLSDPDENDWMRVQASIINKGSYAQVSAAYTWLTRPAFRMNDVIGLSLTQGTIQDNTADGFYTYTTAKGSVTTEFSDTPSKFDYEGHGLVRKVVLAKPDYPVNSDFMFMKANIYKEGRSEGLNGTYGHQRVSMALSPSFNIDRSGVLSCVGVNIGMTYDQFKGYTSIAW